MHPYLLLLQLLAILVLVISEVPKSLGVDDERYLNCSQSFQCAKLENIGYPFWGSNRPDYCGFPEFKLDCSGDAPTISIQEQEFRVLSINQSQSSLSVARADYWNNVCPVSLTNTTTIDNSSSRVLEYASDVQQLLLFYACPPLNIPLPPQLTSQFNCTINSTADSINYYVTEDLNDFGISNISSSFGTCNTTVTVPVSQSAASNLALNISEENLAAALDSGFNLVWDASNTLCQQCQGTGGQCGYNTSSTEFTCYCKDGPNPSNCGGGKLRLKLGLGLAGGVLGPLVLVLVVLCCLRKKLSFRSIFFWKTQNQNRKNLEAFLRNYGPLQVKRYSYLDVKKMTNSFEEKLGQGGFGGVYKGKVKGGPLVAVKVLNRPKGNGEDFMNEVAAISRTSHVNIVGLLGFCFEGSKRALIYEFMPNGSLEKFIFDANNLQNDHHLGWEALEQISLGIARGLEYLHRGCNTRILHFDIKPHNILLDENFSPKISDFGLAKICDRKESIVSMSYLRGTAGYIAPEVFCRNFGGVSHKSDVYSYGMMLSKMVGGRRNINVEVEDTSEIYFPHWIYKRLEQDEELCLQRVTNEEDKPRARKLIIVSLWCIQTDPSNRPAMKEVIEMLVGSVESLKIPPKPYLSSPPKYPAVGDSSSTLVSIQQNSVLDL